MKYLGFILLFMLLGCSNHHQNSDKSMQNVMLEVIKNRKSVRTFTNRDVTDEQIDTLLQAAMCAPSSRNVQPWSFYVIRNAEVKQQLTDSLPSKMFANAPVVIVICGDELLKNETTEQKLNWALDCSAATQNLLLTAQAMGLGAVWTGVFPYRNRIEPVKQILNLPEHIIPLNAIPIGYAAGNEKPKEKFDTTKIHYIR